jgi:hypothetical protein
MYREGIPAVNRAPSRSAVAGETLKRGAAALIESTPSIAPTSAAGSKRPGANGHGESEHAAPSVDALEAQPLSAGEHADRLPEDREICANDLPCA